MSAGPVAVVTGAASGIGAALARACAARGMALALADVEAGPLAEVAESLRGNGSRVLECAIDVADGDAVAAFATAVRAEFGRVGLACLNAGVVGPRLPVWEQRPEDWRWVLSVNLGGVVNGLTAFIPGLMKQGSGHVLVTASTAALNPVHGGGNGPYAASKHAVLGLCETLREDLGAAGHPVGVSVLCPGPVATRIRDAARNRPDAAGEPRSPSPSFENTITTIDADTAAARALAGVDAGRFLVLTNPGSETEAGARFARLERDLVVE
ncbi:SDR family NAD(P)-dependent oxidoreductase [Amycolatopsis acidicola]|uniref:SDR family NAD(P)-dependent oxidoreductase n=1 Tax=Amycolatopsis acidicola TaxID=2596893 RepID=A0A5N0VJB8_9PSEU|nr:SDR family NAD(P)-dependent oxidoreductase [Amycolatopsis acidicola]KAA9166477.1 SDR family NAD(P)-dependent oxidoreductase [Amycolatopsis acidicola]